jgi:tetratricopeptide (TPR) repeat protein
LNFQECLEQLDQALKIDKTCINFLCLKAECLVQVERYEEAGNIAKELLQKNPRDINALYVLGLKEYHELKLKGSVQKFSAALKIFPNFKKAKELREKAKKMMTSFRTGE